jgi:hypothetical protein
MTYLAPSLYQSPNTRFQNDVNLAMDPRNLDAAL